MTEMITPDTSDVAVGDTARITLEGTVTDRGRTYVDLESVGGTSYTFWLGEDDTDNMCVAFEKVAPAVETFGPGSIVRAKQVALSEDQMIFVVCKDGYVDFYNGGLVEPSLPFTSEAYELVGTLDRAGLQVA